MPMVNNLLQAGWLLGMMLAVIWNFWDWIQYGISNEPLNLNSIFSGILGRSRRQQLCLRRMKQLHRQQWQVMGARSNVQLRMEIEIPPESGCSSFSPDDQVIQTSDSEQHHSASTSNAPLSQHDNDESGTTDSGPWYRGHKLNVSWLCSTYRNTLIKVKLGKRPGIRCKLCRDNFEEARKLSRNGQVPLADGVRCYGTRELQRIVDHLRSDAHKASVHADEAQRLWSVQSDRHPWVKVLKSHETEIIASLIALAVDVHNDSKQLTLSAHSWPARSLAQLHSASQIAQYREHGLDADYVGLSQSTCIGTALSVIQVLTEEMMDIVADIVMEKSYQVKWKSQNVFHFRLIGSVDKYSVDNKFITARYLDKQKGMHVVFLAESHSDKRGSEGLLDAVVLALQKLDLEDAARQKLVGLTTDGESANTGRKTGLWARKKTYLERDIICFWCAFAHRARFWCSLTLRPELMKWSTGELISKLQLHFIVHLVSGHQNYSSCAMPLVSHSTDSRSTLRYAL